MQYNRYDFTDFNAKYSVPSYYDCMLENNCSGRLNKLQFIRNSQCTSQYKTTNALFREGFI